MRILQGADLIVHTGDFTSLAAYLEIEAYGPLAAVHGNVDEGDLRTFLPERREVEAEGLRIGVVHDGGPRPGRHERLSGMFPNCALVAYGHSHVPEVARAGETWIVNPGSPTERRRAPFHSMVVVERGEPVLVEL